MKRIFEDRYGDELEIEVLGVEEKVISTGVLIDGIWSSVEFEKDKAMEIINALHEMVELL